MKPSSGLRARAVPIEGLNTKWIATHRGLLQCLLGVADLGLAEGDRLMRVRFLDGVLAPAPGLLDMAVPFGSLALPDGLTVVVVENKETFLALPQAPEGSGAVLVWGSGYTAGALPELPWVRGAHQVLYWGDADADGFAILNALRSRLAADGASVPIVSVAMDVETVQRFLHLAVADPGDTTRVLPHLTDDEERARRFLVASGAKRLEQERVSLEWALARPEHVAVWVVPWTVPLTSREKTMAERLSDKYTYQTFWSEEDGEYVSTVVEFPSLSWLDEDAQRSSAGLRALVAEVIADMQQTGEPIPQPFGQRNFSGRFNVRVSSSLHRRLAMDAAREGVSLNAWVTQKLASG